MLKIKLCCERYSFIMRKSMQAFLILALCFLLALLLPADVVDGRLSQPIRASMAEITHLVPYSIFEIFILFLPLAFVFLFKPLSRLFNRKALLLLTLFVLLSYLLNILVPSRRHLDEISVRECSEQELYSAAELLINRVNSLSSEPDFEYTEQPFGAKRSLFPKLYTALGIYGLYYFPTAECVINTEAPAYICVFSAAHEYAHFKSVMREDEANLFAYKELSLSENSYYRYSADLYAYESIAGSLKRKNSSLYEQLPDIVDSAKADLISHREYAEKYRNCILYEPLLKLNGAVQKIYDKRGALSYSSTADILTCYILSR